MSQFGPTGDVVLVELRAGKMVKEGRMMKPDPRKGIIRVVKGADDGLLHFQWSTRDAAGAVAAMPEDDTIVFPEDAKFVKVDQGSARVFHLSFQEDKSRDLFFWAQEPSADSDVLMALRVNTAINTSAEEYMEAEPSSGPSDAAAAIGGGLFGQGGGSGAEVTGPLSTGVTSADLARILSNISAGQGTGGQQQQSGANPQAAAAAALLSQMAGGGGGMRQQAAPAGPTLGEVLKPEVVGPLLRQPGMLQALGEHLPEAHRDDEDQLAGLASAPQFRHQLELLGMALQTGQLDVSATFGLQPKGFSVQDFLQAIQEAVDREQQQQQGGTTAGQHSGDAGQQQGGSSGGGQS